MSHNKLRDDQNCLNCGHIVEERYCSRCGQENIQWKDSAFHLIMHYVKDLFHYDGKLWNTLKSLVRRPGLVAQEYMEGKRQSHLEPIRFYVFASTVFFLVFFLVIGSDLLKSEVTPKSNYSKRLFHLKQEKEFLTGHPDTAVVNQLITSLQQLSGDTIQPSPDSTLSAEETSPVLVDSILEGIDSLDQIKKLETYSYGSAPEDEMGWLGKILSERLEARNEEYKSQYDGDYTKAMNGVLKELFYKLPQLFFLSLPFFALFLKLLYWRSRKSAYVEHFIFAVYHYAYIFSIMLITLIVISLADTIGGTFLEALQEWLFLGMMLYPFVYLFLSMKRFYSDSLVKLALRYFILMVLMFVTILALFVIVAVLTFLF